MCDTPKASESQAPLWGRTPRLILYLHKLFNSYHDEEHAETKYHTRADIHSTTTPCSFLPVPRSTKNNHWNQSLRSEEYTREVWIRNSLRSNNFISGDFYTNYFESTYMLRTIYFLLRSEYYLHFTRAYFKLNWILTLAYLKDPAGGHTSAKEPKGKLHKWI